MEKIISKEKLQELINLTHTNNQRLTNNKVSQLKWLVMSDELMIDLENLEIPSFLVITRASILYFSQQKGSEKELLETYFDLKIENSENLLNQLQKLKEWTDHFSSSHYKNPKQKKVLDSQFQNFLDFSKLKLQATHEGLPLPDAENGRPHVTSGRCQFNNCDFKPELPTKTYVSWGKTEVRPIEPTNCKEKREIKKNQSEKLIEHLKKHYCYIRGMHSAHEEIISEQKLTIDKVQESGMTQCPSTICNQAQFKTPEELILHLTALGIPPFWNLEMGERATLKYHQFLDGKKFNDFIFKPLANRT